MQLDTLCFATYTRNLKVALAESMSDEDLVRVLLSCILSKILPSSTLLTASFL
nr:MAG TPA: hypothetical protein [Caudoviricetes sp.]